MNFRSGLAADSIDNGNLDRFLFLLSGQDDEHPMHTFNNEVQNETMMLCIECSEQIVLKTDR